MYNPFEINTGLTVAVSIPSKVEIASVVASTVALVKQQDEDYLGAYLKAKAVEEVAKGIQEELKVYAIDEAEELGKDAKYMGCAVAVKNLGDKLSFDHNPEWVNLKAEEDKIKKQIKKLEDDMKNAMKYAEVADKDGFVIPAAIIKEHGGTTISVTLSKV